MSSDNTDREDPTRRLGATFVCSAVAAIGCVLVYTVPIPAVQYTAAATAVVAAALAWATLRPKRGSDG